MGRSPCCDENGLKKGPWTPEEDELLLDYIHRHGHGSWRALPKLAGLRRCGKSCRLRWTNYLRPDIKRGKFSPEEENTILHLHSILGNKWSAIASHLPGRTDNEIKNFWNTHLRKKLIHMGIDPMTHQPRTDLFSCLPQLIALANLKDLIDRHQLEAIQRAKLQCLNHITEIAAISNLMNSSYIPHEAQAQNPASLPHVQTNQGYQFNLMENHDHDSSLISQPLHQSSELDVSQYQQTVPFNFQATLDSQMGQLGLNVNSSVSSSSWADHIPSLTSSNPLPLMETSLSIPGDNSSTVSYGGEEGGGSASVPDWPEFILEDSFLHYN